MRTFLDHIYGNKEPQQHNTVDSRKAVSAKREHQRTFQALNQHGH